MRSPFDSRRIRASTNRRRRPYLPTAMSSTSVAPTSKFKIRGFRIELGEIESTLRRHQAVRGGRRHPRGGHRRQRTTRRLRHPTHRHPAPPSCMPFCSARCLHCTLPSACPWLSTVPVDQTARSTCKQLPAPDDLSRASAEYAPAQPNSSAPWRRSGSRYSRSIPVGARRLFALGGHSLLATESSSLVVREDPCRRPVASHLRGTATLSETFAAAIEQTQRTEAAIRCFRRSIGWLVNAVSVAQTW